MPPVPTVTTTDENPGSMACDALVVGAYAADDGFELAAPGAQVNESMGGLLARLGDSGFKAKLGEVVSAPAGEGIAAASVVVLGLGKKEKVGTREIRKAAGNAGRRLAERESVALALPYDEGQTAAAVEGLILGSYRYTTFKSEGRPTKLATIHVIGGDAGEAARAELHARATLLARDLINEPANTLTPTALADRAKEIAHEGDLVAKVWGPAELTERGFGGLLGVSRGSEEEPRLIQLRYVPTDPKGKVALVGKGVTYDTGGYSLKPPASMEQMKTDMAGGAAVIAVMSVLKELGIQLEVVAYVPATENLVSGNAMKPGDVLRHYGGKTTEVMNTDAEGRLVLADALVFASESDPDAIIDIATLTGHMSVALGRKLSGYFSNDDTLAAELERAAESAGEPTWRMPLWPEYKSELDSETADYRNVGSRYGGAITAAIFLQEFVGKDIPWAHFDIAGPGRAEGDKDEITKGGSAVGVRTLLEWLEERSA